MDTQTLNELVLLSKRILGKQGPTYCVSELIEDCFKMARLILTLEKSLSPHLNQNTQVQSVPHLDTIPIPENRNRKFISTIRPKNPYEKGFLQKCG